MDFNQVVNERASVRRYLTEPVEREQLDRILEAARRSPSWKNQQCWRFVIVSNSEKKQALAETLRQGNPATKAFSDAPLIVVLCARPEDSGSVQGREYYLFDSGLIMETLVLAATNEGLATCIVGSYNDEQVKQILGIPADYRVTAMSPLGRPQAPTKPKPRRELSEIVYWDEWGEGNL